MSSLLRRLSLILQDNSSFVVHFALNDTNRTGIDGDQFRSINNKNDIHMNQS